MYVWCNNGSWFSVSLTFSMKQMNVKREWGYQSSRVRTPTTVAQREKKCTLQTPIAINLPRKIKSGICRG